MEIGQLCVKIAGRDAGKKCVIVDILDKTFVLIDGETRRKKCNIMHLEQLEKTVPLQKGASHEHVMAALGLPLKPKKAQKKVVPRKKPTTPPPKTALPKPTKPAVKKTA